MLCDQNPTIKKSSLLAIIAGIAVIAVIAVIAGIAVIAVIAAIAVAGWVVENCLVTKTPLLRQVLFWHL